MVIGVVECSVSFQIDHLVVLLEVELHDGLAVLSALRCIATLLQDSMQSGKVQRLALT